MPSKPLKRKLSRPIVTAARGVSSRAGVSRAGVSRAVVDHRAFVPLVIVCLLVWVIYRLLFQFPVWFDETIGKALFFGLPVWLYIAMTGDRDIAESFAPLKIRPGLLLGIAAGGLYGFAITFVSLFRSGATVVAAPLFSSPDFWTEFSLALFTGFWETLFFYSWIMTIVQKKMGRKGLLSQLVVVAGIFLVFHIPNIILRTGWLSVVTFGPLLFLFALGQALLFLRNRNGYALVMSQAIWGLALLVHLR